MCECFSLTFIDAILSFIIFGMNIIYVLWGWFTPNDPNRQNFQEQIQELKNYMNFVTYSDSLALFLKLLVLILMKYLCCECSHRPSPRECSQEVPDSEAGQHFPKLFNFNLFPIKKQNIVEI